MRYTGSQIVNSVATSHYVDGCEQNTTMQRNVLYEPSNSIVLNAKLSVSSAYIYIYKYYIYICICPQEQCTPNKIMHTCTLRRVQQHARVACVAMYLSVHTRTHNVGAFLQRIECKVMHMIVFTTLRWIEQETEIYCSGVSFERFTFYVVKCIMLVRYW